jgi:hypothetical protein
MSILDGQIYKKMKKSGLIAIIIISLAISVLIFAKIIFNDQLIGRYLDFSVPPVSYLMHNVIQSNFFSWIDTTNGGFRNPFSTTLIPISAILYFPSIFTSSPWFIARYQLVLTIFLSLYFSYLLASKLLEDSVLSNRQKTALSFASAILFSLNNFLFTEIIYGSNVMYLSFPFLALLIYALLSYEKTKKSKYFWLTIIALCIASSTLQHLAIAYVFILLVLIAYKDIKRLLCIAPLHLMLSLYWLLPLLFFSSEISGGELVGDYTNNFTNAASYLSSAILNKDYFSNRNLYLTALGGNAHLLKLWLFSAAAIFGLIILSLGNIKKLELKNRKIVLGSFIILLLSVFLLKGAREPFGNMIIYAYAKIPLLSLFRSLQRYLSMYNISAFVLFVTAGAYLVKRNSKYIFLIFALVIINALPWLTLDLGTKNIMESGMPSYLNQYQLSPGEKQFYEINNQPLDFSYLTIPPRYSLDFLSTPYTPHKSSGGDSGLVFGNKRFFCAECGSSIQPMLMQMEKEIYNDPNFFANNRAILGKLNLRYIILRKNTQPIGGGIYHYDPVEILNNIKKTDFLKIDYEDDTVAIIKNNYYTPHIFSAQKITFVNKTDKVSGAGQREAILIKTSVFNQTVYENLGGDADYGDLPTIEYKKISPVKYRIVIHRAKEEFPLVFSEAFHSGWNIYLKKIESQTSDSKIYDVGDNDLAADEKDIEQYRLESIISAVGDRYVSKNILGTIQNDNLYSGKFYETFFSKPTVPEGDHFIVGDYSNGWTIKPETLCEEGNACLKNQDGSYDISMIIEFYPQRYFWFGLSIPVLALFLYCSYYLFKKFRERNGK